MAFNPFHSFRRYSKVVFAGLAILCMFTFVLSSGMGRGDFFATLTEMFGGRTGNTVLTLDGKNIDARDFDAVQNQRRLANEYMDAAVGAARSALERRVDESLKRLGSDGRLFEFLLQQRFSAMMRGQVEQLLQLRSFIFQQIS